jgi:hypothetical protein
MNLLFLMRSRFGKRKIVTSFLVLALGALASLSTALGGNRDHSSGHARGGGLVDEGLVDVGDHTTSGNGSTDKGIKLLVSTDGEQQVAGCDTLHLKILACVTGKLKHLSSQVLHDGRSVDGSGGTNALLAVHTSLQETVDTTDRELQTSTAGPRLGCALGAGSLSSLSSLAALAALSSFSSFSSSEIHFD